MTNWNWSGQDEQELIVMDTAPAIAVYLNATGDVVIRQAGIAEVKDAIVIIPRNYANAVLAAIANEVAYAIDKKKRN